MTKPTDKFTQRAPIENVVRSMDSDRHQQAAKFASSFPRRCSRKARRFNNLASYLTYNTLTSAQHIKPSPSRRESSTLRCAGRKRSRANRGAGH
jgi:hypothetical protein